jgi:hypothetical protein
MSFGVLTNILPTLHMSDLHLKSQNLSKYAKGRGEMWGAMTQS